MCCVFIVFEHEYFHFVYLNFVMPMYDTRYVCNVGNVTGEICYGGDMC